MSFRKHAIALASFYVFAIGFHIVLLFTEIGNYFHGGTPAALIALHSVATILCAVAVRLFLAVNKWQRIGVLLVSLLPFIFLLGSLWSITQR